jgi:integrase
MLDARRSLTLRESGGGSTWIRTSRARRARCMPTCGTGTYSAAWAAPNSDGSRRRSSSHSGRNYAKPELATQQSSRRLRSSRAFSSERSSGDVFAPIRSRRSRSLLSGESEWCARSRRRRSRRFGRRSFARRRLGDAALVSVLAYGGLRPGEALALQWRDVQDRTLIVERAVALGDLKETKTGQTRSVRLLAPVAADLAEWRLACGRPADFELVFPTRAGRLWADHDWRNWRKRIFTPAAEAAGLVGFRQYDLRHSFVSLLLAEGRSVLEVAKQAGHSPTMALATYGHVIEELEGAEKLPAEEVIRRARDELVRTKFAREGKRRSTNNIESLQIPKSPLTDSNRRPPPYHSALSRDERASAGSRGHENAVNRIERPKTSDRAWTRVPALVFPQCSLGSRVRTTDACR